MWAIIRPIRFIQVQTTCERSRGWKEELGIDFWREKAVEVKLYVGADPDLGTEEEDSSCMMDH